MTTNLQLQQLARQTNAVNDEHFPRATNTQLLNNSELLSAPNRRTDELLQLNIAVVTHFQHTITLKKQYE